MALVALVPLVALSPRSAGAEPRTSEEIETCMSCHADRELTLDLLSGEKQSLFVDLAAFQGSIHGARLVCTDCHADAKEVPHPERVHRDRAAFSASFRETCRSCHFESYTKALDGVHYAVLSKGGAGAPFCADCHGAHDVKKPAEPRSKVSETCSACHADVAEAYATSVHGRALGRGSADVPVCTDCHRSHDIASPHTKPWRLQTVETCVRCHTDGTRMTRYGLSTNVGKSYLADFHGMSASLYRGQKAETGVTALCIDCHGTHAIRRTREAGPQALKANLLATCRKCHPDATDSFPAAWLSHYEPSPKRAPLVWAVTVFYKAFIPFVIGGLVLQIVLHLWRVLGNR